MTHDPAARVLIFEDDLDDAARCQRFLSGRNGHNYEAHVVASLAAGVATLRENPPDIVLLDLGLQDSAGLDTLASVRAVAPLTPVVVMTRRGDVDTAERALNMGAQDFLPKSEVTKVALRRTVRNTLHRAEAVRGLTERVDVLQNVVQSFVADTMADFRSRSDDAAGHFGLFLLDNHGHVRTWPKPVADLVGVAASDAIGRPLQGVVRGVPKSFVPSALLEGGATWVDDARGISGIATRFDKGYAIRLAVLVTRHETGRATLAPGVARTADSARLLSGSAHALRTPLTPILVELSLLRKSLESTPQERRLELVQRNVERLRVAVDEILDVAALDASAMHSHAEPAFVSDIVAAALRRARDAEAGTRPPVSEGRLPGTLEVVTDVKALTRVLADVVRAGHSFAPRASRLGVDAEADSQNFRLHVHVPGWFPTHEERANVFSPFSDTLATQLVGAGLALYIARRLMVQSGGTLDLVTDPDKGTTFVVALPRVAAEAMVGVK